MKILLTFFILFMSAFATENKLIIDSNNFEAYDEKGIAIFTGNVKMVRIKDKLNAQKVVVYLAPKEEGKSNNREPLKYVATGEVDFEVFTDIKHYKGKGEKVIYMPQEMKYEIIGNGYLNDITEDKTLIGETIYIDQKSGNATVKGSKDKPVRFILNIESKKESPKEPQPTQAAPKVQESKTVAPEQNRANEVQNSEAQATQKEKTTETMSDVQSSPTKSPTNENN